MKKTTSVSSHQKIDCIPIAADAVSWSTKRMAQMVNRAISKPRNTLRKREVCAVLLVGWGSVASPIAVFCLELAIARLPFPVAAEPRVNPLRESSTCCDSLLPGRQTGSSGAGMCLLVEVAFGLVVEHRPKFTA